MRDFSDTKRFPMLADKTKREVILRLYGHLANTRVLPVGLWTCCATSFVASTLFFCDRNLRYVGNDNRGLLDRWTRSLDTLHMPRLLDMAIMNTHIHARISRQIELAILVNKNAMNS